MKIALFGATGRVGSEVLRLALADGHEVTALVRSPEKLAPHERLQVNEGDVRDWDTVNRTIEGADVVFSALGTDRTTTLTEATPHFIRAMEQSAVRRIVTIGTAGILQSRTTPDLLRYEAGDSNRRLTFAAEEHHKALELLQNSGLDWTIVCPTYLPDGPPTGSYRIERDVLPDEGKQISVGDTAEFAFAELLAGSHIGYRVGIAY
ncbi:SDR family oxidoreductase [Sporosarcina sp. 179-K 3D1 HS]|uniref:NAD(P)-dependent oxidoreductase n=1 Tax=Sporosarcina sp. 179-K 3D1 HS TaxID=3232169 RepID=UPI0039A0016D